MAKLLTGTRIYGTGTVDSQLFISGNNSATSTITGALQVIGGVGIGGNLYVGGVSNLQGIQSTNIVASGTLGVTGTSTLGVLNATSGTFSGTLGVTGTAVLNGLQATNIVASGTLGVTGTSTLGVVNATSATFSGTLGVTGTSTLGVLNATSGTFSGTLGVTGTTVLNVLNATTGSFSGALGVTGTSTLGVVNASSGTFSGTLGVTGTAVLNGLQATNIVASGTLGVTGTSTLGVVNATSGTFSGTLGVTGTAVLNGLQATNIVASGTLGVTGTAVLNGLQATNIVASGTLGVTGTSTLGVVIINNSTSATSTQTGALQVAGGVGIGGSAYIGGSLTVLGTLVATVTGVITTATNLAGGTVGQVPYQTGVGQTGFYGPGTAGNVLVSNGATAPSYNNTLTLAGTASSTSSIAGNALQVAGGVGIGGGLYVQGVATFANNVIFSGTSTYIYSTNTVYTDNLISLHAPAGSTGSSHTWTVDDGKDIGHLFHYYKGQDKDAFLGIANDTTYLEWYDNGNESGGVFTGTSYGTFKTGAIILVSSTGTVSTQTGALQVVGGVGVGGGIYVGSNSTFTGVVVHNNNTNATSTQTGAIQIVNGGLGVGGSIIAGGNSGFGTGSYTPVSKLVVGNSPGVSSKLLTVSDMASPLNSAGANGILVSIEGGGGIYMSSGVTGGSVTAKYEAYSSSLGIGTMSAHPVNIATNDVFRITIGATSGVVTITTTTSANSTNSGGLIVQGGQGIWGNLYVGGNTVLSGVLNGTSATFSGTLGVTSTSILSGGVRTTDISASGTLGVTGTSILAGLTTVTNTTSATSTTTGALVVSGGLGVGGAAYFGQTSYVNGSVILTAATIGNFGVSAITAGTDTKVTTSTGAVTIWDISTLQSVTSRGSSTTNAIAITSSTASTSTTTGALTVTGGVGIGGAVYVGGTSNLQGVTATNIVASGTLGVTGTSTLGVLNATSGTFSGTLGVTGTSVLTGVQATNIVASGTLGVTGTSTLGVLNATSGTFSGTLGVTGTSVLTGVQATNIVASGTLGVTGTAVFAGLTTITNTTSATSTNTGALQVVGGVGIGNNIVVGGYGRFTGTFDEATTATGVYAGIAGLAPSSPRLGFFNSTATQNWQIDNYNGAFRWFTPGVTRMELSASGILSITTNTNSTSSSTGAVVVTGGVGLQGNLYVGGTINGNLGGGSAGSLVYQSATSTTAFLAIGLNSYVLTSSGSAPQWTAMSGVSAGLATTATNLAGGGPGQVPYQSSTGTTAFVTTGTAGTVLVSNGTTAPTFNNTLTLAGITNATSTNTGALQVRGGVGIGGALWASTIVSVSTVSNTLDGANFVAKPNGTTSSQRTGYAFWSTFANLPADIGPRRSADIISGFTTSTSNPTGVWGGEYLSFNVGNGGVANDSNLITTEQIRITASSTLLSVITAATGTNSGALQVVGGVGIGGAVYVGGTSNLQGVTATNIVASGTLGVTGTSILAGVQATNIVASGSLGVTGTSFLAGLRASNIVASGTLGVTGTSILAGVQATDIVASGTLGVTSTSILSGVVTIANGSATTSTSTGALRVYGGVGIGGDLFIAGNIATSNTVFNLVANTATTVNFATTASTITIGATTGTTNIRNNLVVAGNLTVQGTSTVVDSTVTNITDPIITLGGGPNNAAPTVDDNKDRGIAFKWVNNAGTTSTGFFGFDDSTGYFTYIATATITNEVVSGTRGALDVNLSGGAQGALVYQIGPDSTGFISSGTVGQLLTMQNSIPTWVSTGSITAGIAATATNLASGGPGQVPYQTAPGATSFIATGTAGTVLVSNGTSAPTFNNTLTLASTTNATSTNSGALQVFGGVGIGGMVYAQNATIANNGTFTMYRNASQYFTIENSDVTTNPTIKSYSGVNNAKSIIYDSRTDSSGTNATAGSPGHLFQIQGTYALQINWSTVTNALSGTQVFGNVQSTATNVGTLVIGQNSSAGLGVGGNIYQGGIHVIQNSTAASSTASGALQVWGGTGIGGALYVGSTSNLQGVVATNIVASGTLGVTGTSTLGVLNATSGTFSGTLGVTGTSVLNGLQATNIVASGTLGVTGTSILAGLTTVTNTTAATNTTTGALQVRGGVGIGGDLYVGGPVTSSVNSATTTGTTVQGVLYNNTLLSAYTSGALTTTTAVTLDTFSTSTYRSAKYFCQAVAGTSVHVSELSVFHDGATSYLNEYGIAYNNSTLGTYDAIVTGSNVAITFTPNTTTSIVVKLSRLTMTL